MTTTIEKAMKAIEAISPDNRDLSDHDKRRLCAVKRALNSATTVEQQREGAWKVQSSDGTKYYQVQLIGGKLRCECEAARYHKPCKHAAKIFLNQ